jgi:molybdenum cofactor cytidylyltransferase
VISETGQRTSRNGGSGGVAARRLFAIVLAAGSGSRFGSTKQLARYRGTALVTRAVRLAESICGARTVLVAGHEWLAVVAACQPLLGFFANNTRHASGMGASIACGVRCVTGAADAALLLLADQPLITRSHLERMIATWIQSPEDIVATSFAATRGPPVLFPGRYFTELGVLQGDQGARSVLGDAGATLQLVAFGDAAADIDLPPDLDGLP